MTKEEMFEKLKQLFILDARICGSYDSDEELQAIMESEAEDIRFNLLGELEEEIKRNEKRN